MCTSFAVYFNEPIYAMNIDHPDRERKFKITKVKCDETCIGSSKCDSCKLKDNIIYRFHCQNREKDRFFDSACMNSLGMFSNYQFLVPNKETLIQKPKDKRISIGNLFSQSQMYMGTVNDLINRIGNEKVYYNNLFDRYALHNLFADKTGEALVLEASENGNEINLISDKFILMTNFPTYEFKGKYYTEVHGDGSDRYKIAYEEIVKNKDNFGVKQAFDVLKKARHSSEFFPTVCSMVFDPMRLYVYLALFGDFNKIWRISIGENIIETYSGFEETHSIKLGTKGVLASELEKYM